MNCGCWETREELIVMKPGEEGFSCVVKGKGSDLRNAAKQKFRHATKEFIPHCVCSQFKSWGVL